MKINTHVCKADLHGHTVNSDGDLTVKEIIEEAKKQGLDYYAITDHDCLNGADEAFDMSAKGINIVYGIELSTRSNDESVHILGYFSSKIGDGPLRRKLQEQIDSRRARAYKMFDLLEEKYNIILDRNVIEDKNSITRGTMANLILDAGYNYTKTQLFNELIGEGCPCYVAPSHLKTEDGIRIIKENGGLAVLAHPCLLKKNDPEDIIKMGVDGIEAIYPKTFNEETKYRDLAKKYKLFITAGSDFHQYNDYKHGNVGSCIIKGHDLDVFLNKLYK